MRVVVDIVGDLKKGDILVYDGNALIPVKKNVFLDETNLKINCVNDKIDEKVSELESKLIKVNKKLEEYHNILQVLTKGE